MKNEITVGSIFCGIGGFCYAFKKKGFSLSWGIDNCNSAAKTYKQNFFHKHIQEDIQKIKPSELTYVDVLTSGFPCQPFSIAGKQLGFDDNRGDGFYQTVRFIKSINPKVFLLENVKNLTSHNDGKTFREMINVLAENGYNIFWKIINASEYVPQNRERVFVVGIKNTIDEKFIFPSKKQTSKKVVDFLENNIPDKYYYTEKNKKMFFLLKENVTEKKHIYQYRRTYIRRNKKNLCPTLTANMGTGGHNVPIILDDIGIRKLTPRECFSLQGFDQDYILPENVSDTQLYKQAGNSVCVPQVFDIANQIKKTLKG